MLHLPRSSQEPWSETPSHRREAARSGRARSARTAHGTAPGPWGDASDAGGYPALGPHPDQAPYYVDDYYQGDADAQGDQYIYVTYPPDLKRRLLERSVAPRPPRPPRPHRDFLDTVDTLRHRDRRAPSSGAGPG